MPVLSESIEEGTEAAAHEQVVAAVALTAVPRIGRKDSKTNAAAITLTKPLSLEHMDERRDEEQASAKTGVACAGDVSRAACLYTPNACPVLSLILEEGDAGRIIRVTQTRRQLLWAHLPQTLRTIIRRLICMPDPDREIHSLGSVFVTYVVPIERLEGHLFRNGVPLTLKTPANNPTEFT